MGRKGNTDYYKHGIEAGLRDERGVRIQSYDRFERGKDYKPATGDEMGEMYRMAKGNMERSQERRKRNGRIKYETIEELEAGIMAYWDYLAAANEQKLMLIPDVEGLCAFLGITRKTMNLWERDNTRDFADTIEQAKNDIAACKKQIGLQGKIPPLVMAMDFNNNHGYTQRQEVVVTPNNPLGDAKSNEELLAKYAEYAQLDGEEPTALPESAAEGTTADA